MTGHQQPPLAVEVGRQGLVLTWPEGRTRLDAATLRSACRCGACRGGRSAPPAVDLALVQAEPAGAYGLQLIFSDGHDRGIYPWSLMRTLSA
jgi:DUF971 family protein